MKFLDRLKWLGELRIAHPSELKSAPEPSEPDPAVVRHAGENDAKEKALYASGQVPQAERPHEDHVLKNSILATFGHSDAAPTETPTPETIMSFKSILADVGTKIKHFFVAGEKIAQAAEPFVDTMFPGVGPLFNTVVTGIGTAEVAAEAAGAQNGSGPQKLAFVVQSVEQSFINWANQNGYKIPDQTQITNAVNGAVAFVNSLSAEPATQPTLTPEQQLAKANALAASQQTKV